MEIKKSKTFVALIERRCGTAMRPPKSKKENSDWGKYSDDMEKKRIIPDIEDTVDKSGRCLNQQPAYDRLLHSEIQMQLVNETVCERVT